MKSDSIDKPLLSLEAIEPYSNVSLAIPLVQISNQGKSSKKFN